MGEIMARIIVGRNIYSGTTCSAKVTKIKRKGELVMSRDIRRCGENAKGGIFLRILLQPEGKDSGDTMIALCPKHCEGDVALWEGVLDLNQTNISGFVLGPK